MAYVDISREQVSQAATGCFSHVDDVPEIIWIDYWEALDQHYLKTIVDKDADGGILLAFSRFRRRLSKVSGVPFVLVVYLGKFTQAEIVQWYANRSRIQ